ncbi:TadE/TadG family type IV pilus assembly protein [Ammoniphilus sp. CFH 90114]|uniref:TadE/TadG family type IV pilus assembly protein n=1 Tax=Ammoniphilus sp. CFH 90114 TaxID=2493665 RepID=UPI00100F702E|nr:TadE family protein [Ammoniphilus sp. CFH 90114]RXT07829.1 pilus assembly protein [Ammoniphilus sp. CFH 90114]
MVSQLVGWIRNERGSQAIEFVAVLPLFFLMVTIVWQFAAGAGAKLTAEAAAMDGARMAIVDGDYQAAAQNVASRYQGVVVTKAESGDYVTVSVRLEVPLFSNAFFNTTGLSLPISSDVTLRKEN